MIGWGFMSQANIPVPGLPLYYTSVTLGRIDPLPRQISPAALAHYDMRRKEETPRG
jgi:hypothetical protein